MSFCQHLTPTLFFSNIDIFFKTTYSYEDFGTNILNIIDIHMFQKLINQTSTFLKNYCELSFYSIFKMLVPKSSEKQV